MKCKLHPKYKAIHKPRVNRNNLNCRCWLMYLEKHPDEKFSNFITGKPMSLNDWEKAGKEAADRLIKGFKDSDYQF